MDKILIVGLGNYPKEYENTRHNVGFKLIDKLSEALKTGLHSEKFNGMYGSISINDKTIYLAKPYTLMNLSGDFIQPFMSYFKIDIDNLLVVCDDVDTEFGKMRVRKSGSSGGQNGLKSIIGRLNTENFKRIKIGIGRPDKNHSMVSHVLSKFNAEELKALDITIDRAINLLVEWINGVDFERLLSKYNQK